MLFGSTEVQTRPGSSRAEPQPAVRSVRNFNVPVGRQPNRQRTTKQTGERAQKNVADIIIPSELIVNP
jgi:hypothetical protein